MPAANRSLPVDEPLEQSAALAARWAAQHCRHDESGILCAGYHGLWQYLRLLKLGKTLGGYAGQYLRAMADLSRDWDRRRTDAPRHMLISGCADYSMLAHALHAFAKADRRPRITVLDICPTPLKLNDWYAQRLGATVELACGDLLRHRPVQAYDLIVTSGFMGYFSPEIRPRLFELYAGMLRPAGQLVFSNRLRPSSETVPVGFTSAQAQQFARKVAELSPQLPAKAALSQTQAYDMALAYAASQQSYPVNSAHTIQQLAARAGLRWKTANQAAGAAVQPGLSGPTLGDGSDYLFVILEK